MFDFKSLVHSLVHWDEPRSPTALSATQLVKNLPEAEYFRAQIEIVKAVAKMNEDQEIALKERIVTLLYVDGRSHTIHRKLTHQFLEDPRHNQAYLPVILAYEYEFSIAYQNALRVYRESGQNDLEKEAGSVALRGLSHFSAQIFWDAFRYIETDGEVWNQCYHFYHYFENLNLAKEPMLIYPDDTVYYSAEQLLLTACMIDLSSPSALQSKEIIAVYLLLPLLIKYVSISEDSSGLNMPIFAIEMGSFVSPNVIMHNMIGERYRYFSTSILPVALQKLKQLIMAGNIPKSLQRLNFDFTSMQWLQLIDRLEVQWLSPDKASKMRSEKFVEPYEVAVYVGFSHIAFYAKVSTNQDKGENKQPWKVIGSGEDSLILVYSGKKDNNIVLGNLVMIQPDDDVSSIGLITRLVRQKDGGAKVAVKIIGRSPVGVTLTNPDEPLEIPVNALYITQDNSTNGQRCFLLPLQYIRENHQAILTLQGKSYQIRLKGPYSELVGCANCDFDTLSRVD